MFKKLIRMWKQEIRKRKLIKELARKRIPTNAGIDVDSLSDFDLHRLPEATIVIIVGTYCTIKATENLPEEEIFEKMTMQRASIGDFGESLSSEEVINSIAALRSTFKLSDIPLTLNNYIKYMLNLEYPHTPLPNTEQIDEAIEKAKKIFT